MSLSSTPLASTSWKNAANVSAASIVRGSARKSATKAANAGVTTSRSRVKGLEGQVNAAEFGQNVIRNHARFHRSIVSDLGRVDCCLVAGRCRDAGNERRFSRLAGCVVRLYTR